MSYSVRQFSSHLMYVDKHSLHIGRRNPNMETLIATISVKGRGPVVLVSSERFSSSRNSDSNHESNIHHPAGPSFSILQMPNWILCIIQWLKASQGSIWLPYAHSGDTVTVRGQSSLALEPKFNALEIQNLAPDKAFLALINSLWLLGSQQDRSHKLSLISGWERKTWLRKRSKKINEWNLVHAEEFLKFMKEIQTNQWYLRMTTSFSV